MRKRKRVVVFGIFDGVHDGHRDLFRQARYHGDELIVIVGRDSASLEWKGKKPVYSEKERLSLILKERYVDNAVLGDEEQSTYRVLKSLNPNVICVGYDQDALFKDLERWQKSPFGGSPAGRKNIQLVRLKSFHSEIYHNSKLRV